MIRELQQRLRENPRLIPAALEEFLRLYTPYRGFARTANRDVQISGCPIRAGEPIALNYASANRDEEVSQRPMSSTWTGRISARVWRSVAARTTARAPRSQDCSCGSPWRNCWRGPAGSRRSVPSFPHECPSWESCP